MKCKISIVIGLLLWGLGTAFSQSSAVSKRKSFYGSSIQETVAPSTTAPATQELTVVSMQPTMEVFTGDKIRNDLNGNACAVVYVQAVDPNLKFQGNIMGDVKFESSQYVVYLTSGTKNLKILGDTFFPTTIQFSDYGIDALVSKGVYALRIVVPTPNTNANSSSPANGDSDIKETENKVYTSQEYYNLGVTYYQQEAYTLAVEFYQKSADMGNPRAQNNLGWCYYNGNGVDKDDAMAFYYFKKAADQGLADAQCNVGSCYQMGEGVEKDLSKAVEWYQKSAIQGDALSQVKLAGCYQYGNGVEKNYEKAAEFYQKAADQGYSLAYYFIGYCYEIGSGVNKDLKKAAQYYKMSADAGHAIGQYSLGEFYYYGEGVEKDYDKALEWYQKAASQGYQLAIEKLHAIQK